MVNLSRNNQDIVSFYFIPIIEFYLDIIVIYLHICIDYDARTSLMHNMHSFRAQTKIAYI